MSSRRVILDCGSKTLAAERLSPRSQTFALVVAHSELQIERLFEERAILTAEEPTAIPLGDRVRIIPNYACATINLHSRMMITGSGEVSDVWPIDARGWATEAGSLRHPFSSTAPVR